MTSKLRIPGIILLLLLALAAYYTLHLSKTDPSKTLKPAEEELFDEEEAELGLIELDAESFEGLNEQGSNDEANRKSQPTVQISSTEQAFTQESSKIKIPAPPKEMKYESGVNYEIKIPASNVK